MKLALHSSYLVFIIVLQNGVIHFLNSDLHYLMTRIDSLKNSHSFTKTRKEELNSKTNSGATNKPVLHAPLPLNS